MRARDASAANLPVREGESTVRERIVMLVEWQGLAGFGTRRALPTRVGWNLGLWWIGRRKKAAK
ncbi:hypothetical protein BRAS3843_1680003 [Bradyrhizobium sp. STM 3843]|nr:hypothetical protein BRAS3843_1680003 [Bradyrhizobium sp. STM 3843]